MKSKNVISILGFTAIIIFLLSMMVITGCAQQPSTSPQSTSPSPSTSPATVLPKYGGILKITTFQDALGIGLPSAINSMIDVAMSSTCLERLISYNAKGEFVPQLTDSWATDPSAKTITLKLKKGVKFHDGTDFNAAAVKWNLESYQKSGRKELPLDMTMDIVDDYTLKLNLSNWNNTVVTALCSQQNAAYIISPTAWKNAPGATTDKERSTWANANPVGTGPFKFVSWQKDVKQVYKIFDGYRQKGKPYLDGIEWSVIKDPNTQAAAFQSKEVDVLYWINSLAAKQLKGAGYTIAEGTAGPLGLKTIFTNSADPKSPFNNIKLRQAISYAIDRKPLVDNLFAGYAAVTQQWGSPTSMWSNPDYKGVPFDPDMAKKLVAEAGYPNGIKAKMLVQNTPDDITLATAIQSMLAKANIQVELDPADAGRFFVGASKGFESMCLGMVATNTDPGLLFPRALSVNGVNWKSNFIHPDDLEKLLGDMTGAPDQASKQKLVWQAQQVIFEKYCIFTPVLVGSGLAAKQDYVKDDGLMTTDPTAFTPENAWLNK